MIETQVGNKNKQIGRIILFNNIQRGKDRAAYLCRNKLADSMFRVCLHNINNDNRDLLTYITIWVTVLGPLCLSSVLQRVIAVLKKYK